MSYYIKTQDFKRWLDKAQLSLFTKNKVRKDLWTDLGDIVQFEYVDNSIPLSSSEFLSIQSFLQTEGRADVISNDSFLNWVTTLNDLRRKYIRETGIRSELSSQTSEVSQTPKEEKEDASKLRVET